MNILVLGDVVSGIGCDFLRKKLPAFKRLKSIDLCIANGENSATGNGITPESATHLFKSGVDFITTGNHAYRRKEIYDFYDENEFIIRPANLNPSSPGRGYALIDMGRCSVAVINLLGSMYGEVHENPFLCADRILKQLQGKTNIILLDFHAEATSEKKALGFYLDGRISALFGTHTHVLTADERVLPGGTGYITDIGMCGVIDSVLGINSDIIISKFKTALPARFDPAEGDCMVNGCIFTIDEKTGRCLCVERVCFE